MIVELHKANKIEKCSYMYSNWQIFTFYERNIDSQPVFAHFAKYPVFLSNNIQRKYPTSTSLFYEFYEFQNITAARARSSSLE